MSLKTQAISGVKWSTIATVIIAALSIVKLSVLTRLLDPADFGLMAIVIFVLGFMDMFMDMGITSAILHKQKINSNTYSSLYWLNVLFSILLFFIILALTPLLANYNKAPELNQLIPFAGVVIILSALGRQFKTIFQKQLQFKRIAVIDVLANVLAFIVAVTLAYNNYGVYALVYAALALYGFSNVVYFILGFKQKPITLHFNYAETKPFLKIGAFEVGSQVANYFNRDIDILIIGGFFGADVLGGYSLAKQLVFRPAQIINPILTKVASPLLASIQNNKLALKSNYLKLLTAVSSVNLPIYLGLIVFAPWVITIFYGEDFVHITIVVRLLAVYMTFRAIGNPIGSLLIATGRTDLGFYWNIVNLLIMPLAIYIGAQFSIEAVALCVLSTRLITFVPGWYFLIRKLIQASFLEYIRAIIPSVAFVKQTLLAFRGVK